MSESFDLNDVTGEWDYSSLPTNVRVGDECFIERRDSFARYRSEQPIGLMLGNRVQVFTWSDFNVDPSGILSIGDDSVLVGAVFMCAHRIVIGARVVVSYHVTIADSDFHPRDPAERRRDAIANAPGGDRLLRPRIETAPVTIGDDVRIGIGAIILKGITVGDRAQIAAGAVVTRNVPADTFVAGNPARPNGPSR